MHPAHLLAGKSKKEDGVKEDKRKRDPSTQASKSSRPTAVRIAQQPPAAQQTPPGQQGTFMAHKEIKLTLLNKVGPGPGSPPLPPPQPPRAHSSSVVGHREGEQEAL